MTTIMKITSYFSPLQYRTVEAVALTSQGKMNATVALLDDRLIAARQSLGNKSGTVSLTVSISISASISVSLHLSNPHLPKFSHSLSLSLSHSLHHSLSHSHSQLSSYHLRKLCHKRQRREGCLLRIQWC